MFELVHGDALEELRKLPDGYLDSLITDPPYNISKAAWDTYNSRSKAGDRDHYILWLTEIAKECERAVKERGALVYFHQDAQQFAQLIVSIEEKTDWRCVSLIPWHKRGYRTFSWKNKGSENAKQKAWKWVNTCEYVLVFERASLKNTTKESAAFAPLRDWYLAEVERLGVTMAQIKEAYTRETGRPPHMVEKHYFNKWQFTLPTRAVWEGVYAPLGFSKSYDQLTEERRELFTAWQENTRTFYRSPKDGCEAFFQTTITTKKRHACEKPQEILSRLIYAHTPDGGRVGDVFAGSGAHGVAAIRGGFDFWGVERDPQHFKDAETWLEETAQEIKEQKE